MQGYDKYLSCLSNYKPNKMRFGGDRYSAFREECSYGFEMVEI